MKTTAVRASDSGGQALSAAGFLFDKVLFPFFALLFSNNAHVTGFFEVYQLLSIIPLFSITSLSICYQLSGICQMASLLVQGAKHDMP